ncbi:HU family DNA-binding protein [Buchnera aphidicola]|uniref:HU family DNA-binding protein n=1 Tax=Buchnera aphidicola TaxID=9 RepID=UPI002238A738|nr:HU family DNA-binding protein [Buchnera aphidicola]MCW5197397.1 HU family DNA-binding protein [Buchnera aphidicola (Chaitophorus viminalis)]
MNKSQLIDIVAKKSLISKIKTKTILDNILSEITNSLKKEENVQLVGFGTFKINKRSARTGRNPKTGKEIQILATKIPSFISGKTLKKAVK